MTTTAAHIYLVKSSAPPQDSGPRKRKKRSDRSEERPAAQWNEGRNEGRNDVELLLHEQRSTRLSTGAQAFARLAQVIRLISSAYGVQVRWLDERLDNERLDNERLDNERLDNERETQRETQRIAARLALAHQMPLVIGDPARGILWLARRPFDLVLHRARTGTLTLEPLARGAHVADSSDSSERPDAPERPDALETSMEASAPAVRLLRVCGPAASALVVQSEALLTLAPQVANGAAHQRHLRYVLAAPHNIHRLRGELLTSWRERLLCLSVDQNNRRDEQIANVRV
ncbi:MAG TPA: hypothetical protein VF120_10495 [Ktedonobacterales bacterium]